MRTVIRAAILDIDDRKPFVRRVCDEVAPEIVMNSTAAVRVARRGIARRKPSFVIIC
jgi:hypothetical protein